MSYSYQQVGPISQGQAMEYLNSMGRHGWRFLPSTWRVRDYDGHVSFIIEHAHPN